MDYRDWFKQTEGEILDFKTGEVPVTEARMRISFSFKWYDLWIGVFVDTKKRRIYICPFFCCVFCLYFG